MSSLDHLLDLDSDEDEPKVWEQRFSGRSGFIFLIDARKHMFQGGKESHFAKSFKCCLNGLLQIAREQRYDLVAIVLFGTERSSGKFAPRGCVLYQPLLTPSVSLIKNLMKTIEDHFEDIVENYGQGNSVSLNKILNYCKNLFHHCRSKLYTKSIILFTSDPDPLSASLEEAHAARKRAEELREHYIELDVVGMGASFDSVLFYKELVLTARGELLKNWVGKDPVKKVSDVEAEIASLTKKATRHYGMFYLGKGVWMKLLFYKLYHEPLKMIWASKDDTLLPQDEPDQAEADKEVTEGAVINNEKGDSNEQKAEVSIFDQETQELPPGVSIEEASKQTVLEKYPLIGGQYIPISKKELRAHEPKMSPGLTLLGFRPLDSIPIQTIDEPYFLIPDSTDKVGSDIFCHLLESCLRKAVAPVCWYSLHRSSGPQLVVLFPSEPAEYLAGVQHPHGFHLLKLPFSDMINEPVTDDLPEVESSESQIEAAKGIIKKTTMLWSPGTFSDVEYKSRLAMVEAIAMEYPDVAEVEDQTNVDLMAIEERLGDLNVQFTDCSHLPGELLGKRPLSAESSTGSASRPPKQANLDLTDLIARVRAGEAHKLTVAQLRDLLKVEGIRSLTAMTKPRLISIANERFACKTEAE